MFARKRYLILALLVLVTSILVVLPIIRLTPSGRFHATDIACEGTAYWEFNNGKITQKVPTDGKLAMNYETKEVGTYVKQDDRWLWVTPAGEKLRMRISLYSLEVSNLDGSQAKRYPRLFFRP